MGIVEFGLRYSHQENIARYERLLRTQLTDFERNWIRNRIEEEKSAVHLFHAARSITN
jgi:hypothetical protein